MHAAHSTRAALACLAIMLSGCVAPTTPLAPIAASTPVLDELARNKAAVRRWYEEGDNKGNVAIADEVFAPDVQMYHPTSPEPLRGIEPIKQGSLGLHKAFPGFIGKVLDLTAEGDKVTCRWSLEGVHQGEFLGIPPTNKPFKLQGLVLYRFAAGKIVEGWYAADMYTFFTQLGAMPPGSPAAVPTPQP